ncbi:hypothetical protein ANCCEY_04907 [Ancylostoma ceylanicum]|uniref:Uncharacterized protein n=1 Tax=Ancylostoma ceylanicum TaxID=53326 RepID=A0A0D6M0X0_9BILA|nr:hypothetical protein ANCCEY_04907 [Ancylostoma ceylanicum]
MSEIQMASGRNTKIGCAVKMRGNVANVYCLYDLSSVARGLEPDALGDFTPKAKKMIKLVCFLIYAQINAKKVTDFQGYDCYLERVALRTATCPPVRADQKLFFWNMHNVSDSSMSNMDAAKEENRTNGKENLRSRHAMHEELGLYRERRVLSEGRSVHRTMKNDKVQ